MEINNPEPTYAGTLDLETGKVETVIDNPNLTETPNATPENTGAPEGGNEGGGEPVTQAAEVVTQTEAINNDYLKTWNEKAGTQFQTDDEAIEYLKVSRADRAKILEYENRLKDFDDPVVKDIAKLRKAGLKPDLYFKALEMDVDKMDAKQVIKEAFFLENAGSNPKLLEQRFEREFKVKYGSIGQKPDVSGLDEFEAQQKLAEFNNEQEFLQLSLEDEHLQKKRKISEWKTQNITIPDVQQQQGMTDEQIQQYTSQVESFVSKNENVEIPVGDKLKFNFGLKEYKETLKKDLLYPLETLKKHGIDVDTGVVDVEKLGKLLTSAYIGQNMAKPLSDWAVDARNIEFLKQKVIQPAPSQTIAGGALPGEDDLLARASKGLRAQREAQSQS